MRMRKLSDHPPELLLRKLQIFLQHLKDGDSIHIARKRACIGRALDSHFRSTSEEYLRAVKEYELKKLMSRWEHNRD